VKWRRRRRSLDVGLRLATGDTIDLVADYVRTDHDGIRHYVVRVPFVVQPDEVDGITMPVLPARSAVAIALPRDPGPGP
jgi:hypothetical protein